MRERGTFVPATHDQERFRAVCTLDLEDRILTHIVNSLAASTRRITAVEDVLQSVVWQVLQEQCLYAYYL
jgi:hypothetical protein